MRSIRAVFLVSFKSMKTQNDQEKNNRYARPYQVKLYEDTEIMIGEDDSVRLIDEVLGGIDYSELSRAYYLHKSFYD